VHERNDDLEKVMGSLERSKALKGKAQECRQVKKTARDSMAECAEWVAKPSVRYLLEGRQPPRRPFRMNEREMGLLFLGMLKGHGV